MKMMRGRADVLLILDQLKSIIADERVKAIKAQKMVRWKLRMGGD